jgi:hypothetical protein
MVNELVILPDIEKRLEAFVRLSHAIIVFPGGVGTVEEVLYILSIKMQPENIQQIMPLIFACAEEHASYFEQLDEFLVAILGEQVRQHYQIIIGQPDQVAIAAKKGVQQVQRLRRKTQESYGFNWQLKIPHRLQQPFIPSHESMAALQLHAELDIAELAINLRAVFSGIVAGNVKTFGIDQVRLHGPYKIHADANLSLRMNKLLSSFVEQGRMAIVKDKYEPSYELVQK